MNFRIYPSKNLQQFLEHQKQWEALGGKLPVQSLPSKVEDISCPPSGTPSAAVAYDRLRELGIPFDDDEAAGDMLEHARTALKLKGGCIIFRFREQMVLANLERIEP